MTHIAMLQWRECSTGLNLTDSANSWKFLAALRRDEWREHNFCCPRTMSGGFWQQNNVNRGLWVMGDGVWVVANAQK